MEKRCPNTECQNHTKPEDGFYVKKGYFKTAWNHQPVPRYKCKACGKYFSSSTFKATYRQKKPQLNKQIFKLYCSGTTQRRLAKVLGATRKTISEKVMFLAELARKHHETVLAAGGIKTTFVQFDEMESFEHTRLKPLSIALAVRAKTGQIIDAQVAIMNCKGHLAALSQQKYGWRQDNRQAACEDVLKSVQKCVSGKFAILTDAKTSYVTEIKKWLPNAMHTQIVSRAKNSRLNPRQFDPMFMLNHICARIRNDLSRMFRKSWTTTKKPWGLQNHLDLYIAWNNKYELSAM